MPVVTKSKPVVQTLLHKAMKLHQQNKIIDAKKLYEKILKKQPEHPVALHYLGLLHHQSGNHKAALNLISKAISLQSSPAMYCNLGNVYFQMGDFDKAVSLYKKTIEIQPDFILAYNGLAGVMLTQQLYSEAVYYYKKALGLDPHFIGALNGLAATHIELKEFGKAIPFLQKSLAINPDNPDTIEKLTKAYYYCCAWDKLELLEGKALTMLASKQGVFSPFFTLMLPTTAQDQLVASQAWLKSKPKINQLFSNDELDVRKNKIRIGYLSSDMHAHATSYLMAELFEKHDKDQFEVFIYSCGPQDNSEVRQRIKASVLKFNEVRSLSAYELAKTIHQDEIHILVDLKGYTENNRWQACAYKPAPIQVNFLGYPGTSGAPYMDYIITDHLLIPSEERGYYSETPVYMPGSYQVNDSKRQIAPTLYKRQELGLPEEGIVFCAFNHPYKIRPRIFDSWMRILQAVPGSVLWLLKYQDRQVESNLQREALRYGVDSQRLIFAPPVELSEHLARMQLADLFLDTTPVCAHTSASDALWAGLPVLTIKGKSFVSRVAASLLCALEMSDLVLDSYEDYMSKAIELASSPEQLNLYKAMLAEKRLTSNLFNSSVYAKNLEQAYIKMWQNYKLHKLPQIIDISNR